VPQSLRRTWALLALALAAILPVAFVVVRDFLRDVFPRCEASIEAIREPWTHHATDDDLRGVPGLFNAKLTYADRGRVVAGAIELLGKGPKGEPCACGSVKLRSAGITSSSVQVRRGNARSVYVVVDGRTGGDGIGELLLVPGGRHLQIERLASRRHLPALVVLLAIGALGVAYLRGRRGIAYATRIHAWTEATLDAGGRVEAESGETLGVLDSGGRRVGDGPVLVDPAAVPDGGALYRDVPILARRHVALGTHERWTRSTMRELRDARALSAISVVCSGLALLARALGA
jgi:hypothetical protein